jgi:hypothetical protein
MHLTAHEERVPRQASRWCRNSQLHEFFGKRSNKSVEFTVVLGILHLLHTMEYSGYAKRNYMSQYCTNETLDFRQYQLKTYRMI